MGQDVNTRGELKPTEPHPTAHFAKIWKDMNTTEKPTGYGKRLSQLTAEEMAWWRKNAFQPTHGKAYLCRRGCKEHGTQAGKVYVYNAGSLEHHSARTVTVLLNGYNALRQPYAFEQAAE